jgi:four helix bundle protein
VRNEELGMKSRIEEENTARWKSKAFAISIIKIFQFLCKEKREFVLSKQLLRSGTSIGANLAEAEYAISKKEFLAKVYILFKECAETKYWLELLHETDFLDSKIFETTMIKCEELLKMLSSTTKTLKQQLSKESNK